MLKTFNKYFFQMMSWVIILIVLLIFYLYVLLFDWKLRKLERKIKKNFKKRLDFIPVLYDLTEWKIKMHGKMFEKILDYRNIWIFNYKQMNFIEIINNEINIHKELIFLFKVVNKLDSLKSIVIAKERNTFVSSN